MFTSKADEDFKVLGLQPQVFWSQRCKDFEEEKNYSAFARVCAHTSSAAWLPLLGWRGSRGTEERWNREEKQ